ncbi:MAG TPA: NADPH-dependent assimilatory sulfite reductase hemoprotein subunit [Rhodanobacteraceae bacterium]
MTDKLSALEHIKADSRYLRGTIAEGLADPLTGAISDPDTKLLKFHGSYMQDNRDIRDERRKQKLEPDYQFMVRLRLPGGVLTAPQWLAMDELAERYAERGLRITTRQTFQFHGIRKEHLRDMIHGINDCGLSTRAACGDDTRNVITSVNPEISSVYDEVFGWALKLKDHVATQTSAYEELWLNDGPADPDAWKKDAEPLYGKAYLNRKYKFGFAIPPNNDIDVFNQDFGLIAIIEDGKLAGFNIAPGGSMGTTAGDPSTYPSLGDLIGFVTPDQLLETCWQSIVVQGTFGDRGDRKHARLKYTIDRNGGLPWYRDQLQSRLSFKLAPPRPYHFTHNGDRFGWVQGEHGKWHLTLSIQSGRLLDDATQKRRTGMREIARIHKGNFRLTCDQNVVIAGVDEADKAAIDALAAQYQLDEYKTASGIRKHAISCVALPTCGLAMAESERYLPTILTKMEVLLAKYDLLQEDIHFRMSGCPNGCSRPYISEIALVGRAIGRYDLRLGGDHAGERLNAVYLENTDEEHILTALDELFGRFAAEREPGEHFGDFIARVGVVVPPARRPALEYA